MLIAGNTCGQDFGDNGVGDHRETEVDRPGSSGVLQIIHFAQGEYKGKDALLVVKQDLPRLTAFQTAKGQR